MSNPAQLIIAKPDTVASGQITHGNAQSGEENARAFFGNTKTLKQFVAANATILSRPAFRPKAESPKFERVKNERLKNERQCIALGGIAQDTQESGWVTLRTDACKARLHTQGRWQADVEIATNLTRVLLAQIMPTCIERTVGAVDASSARAVVYENLWIDVLLHQIKSEHAAICPLSMLELAAYRVVNGDVKLIKSVKSSPMPMEMLSVFTLGYRLKNSIVTIDICSDLDRLTTTHIDIENFGETLPIVKLRSGRALPNGIFRAKYRQVVSWSA